MKTVLAAAIITTGVASSAYAYDDCTAPQFVDQVKAQVQRLYSFTGAGRVSFSLSFEGSTSTVTDYTEPSPTYTCQLTFKRVIVVHEEKNLPPPDPRMKNVAAGTHPYVAIYTVKWTPDGQPILQVKKIDYVGNNPTILMHKGASGGK